MALSYKKIQSLGEEDWRINMVGFTAIDLIKNKLIIRLIKKGRKFKSSKFINFIERLEAVIESIFNIITWNT